ncbi:MAG: helix-turn-helix transcriptional regulator [Treponema sp.]|nr:helix-turn-helix transcriptional regulator [Treponema sp.]
MLALTKKPPIKLKRSAAKNTINSKRNTENMLFFVSCPVSNSNRIKQYLEKHGCILVDNKHEWVNAKGLFTEHTSANLLIGARGKENITQMQLSELTGIPRRHISDMENGRRPIGKQNALKFAKTLNIDYRLFL